jgi:hypothetical protein
LQGASTNADDDQLDRENFVLADALGDALRAGMVLRHAHFSDVHLANLPGVTTGVNWPAMEQVAHFGYTTKNEKGLAFANPLI